MPLLTLQSAKGYGFGKIQSSAEPGSFYSIATYTVGTGSSTASITFSSIPSDYKHLQLRGLVRNVRSGEQGGELFYYVNNNRTAASWGHYTMSADGSGSVGTVNNPYSGGGIYAIRTTASAADSRNYSAFQIDIYNYTNTNHVALSRHYSAFLSGDNNNTNTLEIIDGYLGVTNAVSSIKFELAYGTAIDQHSTFALYGIKG